MNPDLEFALSLADAADEFTLPRVEAAVLNPFGVAEKFAAEFRIICVQQELAKAVGVAQQSVALLPEVIRNALSLKSLQDKIGHLFGVGIWLSHP